MEWYLLKFILLFLFQVWLISASEVEESVPKSQGKACPGCGGSDCSNTPHAFGVPVLQLLGGGVVGLIWAGIVAWLYIWINEEEEGSEGYAGSFFPSQDSPYAYQPPKIYSNYATKTGKTNSEWSLPPLRKRISNVKSRKLDEMMKVLHKSATLNSST